MSTTIKTGWLNDKNGDKFAPKTLTSQVQTNDGVLLEDKIQADLNTMKSEIIEDVSIDIDSELSSTSTNPVQNKAINAEFNSIKESKADWNQNDENAVDYVKNRTHYKETILDGIVETIEFTGQQVFADRAFDTDTEYTFHVYHDDGEITLTGKFENYSNGTIGFSGYTLGGENPSTSNLCLYSENNLQEIYVACKLSMPVDLVLDVNTEVYHTLDERYIPDTIARLNTQIQSDWTQNDENAVGYIKNRPFYEDGIIYTLIKTYTATKTSDNTLSFTFNWQDGYDTAFVDSGLYFFVNEQFITLDITFSDVNGRVRLTVYSADGTSTNYSIAADSSTTVELVVEKALTKDTYDVEFCKDLTTKVIQIDAKYLPKATDNTPGAVILSELVGQKGTGGAAEIFNHSMNIASGECSHAEGASTTASGSFSHAEGNGTTASGASSHAEGSNTEASGGYAHSEGGNTLAFGNSSHAEGNETIAKGACQHVEGTYNIEDGTEVPSQKGEYVHIVGNGTTGDNRSNAHTLDWEGNAWFEGDVYVGSTSGTNKDEGSKKLATEEYVDTSVASIVNSAPETLNTLNELAAALGNDENFAVTVATQIGKKVDKEAGKGLSTNDYTDEEKLKLSKVLTTDNTTEYEPTSEFHPATKKYVDTTVAEVVNSSPETLAALQELSAALEEDANLSASLSTQIGNKVDKVDGMGLSSNDYDSETKTFVDTLKTKNLATQEIIDLHLTDVSNPHIVTKAQVGLSNVDNVKQYSKTNPPPYPVTSVNGQTGAVSFTTEEWTFTLSDGSTVTKRVMLG